LSLFSCLAVLTTLGPATAQPPGHDEGGTDDLKKQFGASDEEWKVIGPKLQKVIAARQALAADARGAGPGFVGPGGFGGPGPGGFGPFPGGPGGFGARPQPGQVMPAPLQDALQLTGTQRKQLEELQKQVDGKLAKILTDEQKKQLKAMQQGGGGPGSFSGGPGGLPGGIPDGPGGFPDGPGGFPGNPGGGAGGPGGFRGGPEGGPPPGGFGGPAPNTAIAQAQADLKTTLSDPKHTPDEIREKVLAVRKARQKVRADLEAAQKDMLRLLTAEQEAVLVSLGYLD
jgi:Spy/CpxP family protein refolding chaperone